MISSRNGFEEDFSTVQDFRQVSLIKDPLVSANTPASSDTYRATRYLSYSGTPSQAFEVDEVITGNSAAAPQAFITEIDTSNAKIYYTQNSKTGYTAFNNGETITGSSSTASVVLDASAGLHSAEFLTDTGDMIFLENRAPISRSSTQIEDIKLIIEF